MFRKAGRWVIVDYKTDRIDGPPPEKLLRAYRGQLDVYRRAWSALSSANEAEIDTAIYFMRPNLLVST